MQALANTVTIGTLFPLETTSKEAGVELHEVMWHQPQDDSFLDHLIEDGKIISSETIERFCCLPEDHPMMAWGGPEFLRWYDPSGERRSAPLDFDELVDCIARRDLISEEEAIREVALNSRAKKGDKELWRRIELEGYGDYVAEFWKEEYGFF